MSSARAGILLFTGASDHMHGGFSTQYAQKDGYFTLDDFQLGQLVIFKSIEHYMQAGKALAFGDHAVLHRILAAPTPKQARQLGNHVEGFNEETWEATWPLLLSKATIAKFSQNDSLRQILLSTKDSTIGLANPKSGPWGTGMDVKDPRAHDTAGWSQNRVGKVLMWARSQLREDGQRSLTEEDPKQASAGVVAPSLAEGGGGEVSAPPLKRRRGEEEHGQAQVAPPMALTAEALAKEAYLRGMGATRFVCSEAVAAAFARRMRRMLAEGGSGRATATIVFHWTPRKNFRPIDNCNLQVPGAGNGVTHQTDEGFYGRGIYTSPNFELYKGYGNTDKAFLCLCLAGRQFPAQFPQHMGADLEYGYDSHISGDDDDGPAGTQWVLFSADQLLPLFLVDDAGLAAGIAAAWQVAGYLSSRVAEIADDAPALVTAPRVPSGEGQLDSVLVATGGGNQIRGCSHCGGPRPNWEGCPCCAGGK